MKPEKSCLPRLANFKTRCCREWKEKFSAPPVAKIHSPALQKRKKFWENFRPAGSWRPLKCIFSGKGKSHSQRAAKPRSGVILTEEKDSTQRAGSPALSVLCTEKPDRGSLRQLQSKFLPRCQNPQFCGFAPRGKLVGECLPQTLLCALAGEKTENSFCYFPKSCPMGGVRGKFLRPKSEKIQQ